MYSERTRRMVKDVLSKKNMLTEKTEHLADVSNITDVSVEEVSYTSELNRSSLPDVELIDRLVFDSDKENNLDNFDIAEKKHPPAFIFDPNDQDDDVNDPDYIPSNSRNKTGPGAIESESESEDQVEDEEIGQSVILNDSIDTLMDESISATTREENTTQTNRIKRPRKTAEKIFYNRLKHPIRTSICNCKNKKCLILFTEAERKDLHGTFWSLEKNSQNMWLFKQVQEKKAKRKVLESRRNFSRTYNLPKINGNDENKQLKVCQKFFLSTLGYRSTAVVDYLLKKCKDDHGTLLSAPSSDKRGRHVPTNKKVKTPIKDHINSFNPKPSHYRREHAPNRKYLPADISIKDMHSDYNAKNPENKVSYETYRKVVDALNIGFYEIEADKCDTCSQLNQANDQESQNKKEEHMAEYHLRRSLYQKDAQQYLQNPAVKVYAVDMQKVFLLPRMPKVKNSFFTSRLIVFNETFASLKNNDEKHFAILWHEAIAGRRGEDVAGAFIKFLDLCRDASDVILWADNCTAQNKNWLLFSILLLYINNKCSSLNSITIKYLLKGHTYNSADGLHGKIEQSARKYQTDEDMNDFVEVVEKSSKRLVAKEMVITDFLKVENIFRNGARKNKETESVLLKNIVEIRFVKERQNFFYKTDFKSEIYVESNVGLKKNIKINSMPPNLNHVRGINSEKKERILKNLLPHMKPSRRKFWKDIPSTEAQDLLEEGL